MQVEKKEQKNAVKTSMWQKFSKNSSEKFYMQPFFDNAHCKQGQ